MFRINLRQKKKGYTVYVGRTWAKLAALARHRELLVGWTRQLGTLLQRVHFETHHAAIFACTLRALFNNDLIAVIIEYTSK